MNDITQVLLQAPILGIFIWYTLELMKRQQSRDEKYLEALEKITKRLEEIKLLVSKSKRKKIVTD